MLFDMIKKRTYGMSLPPSPTQFGVPSVALIPAVMPKGGMSDVSTEPAETEEEEAPAGEASTEEETSGEVAGDGEPVPWAAAGAAEVIVMKVLGRLPPLLLLEKPPPPPPPPPWPL